MERAQDRHGLNGGERKFWRHVIGDARKADDLDLQAVTRGHRPFEVDPGIVLKANRERAAGHGLLNGVGMQRELVAKRGPNEIRTV